MDPSNNSFFSKEPDQGDGFLTEGVIGNAGTLFKDVPANPFSIIDLCQVLEAAITHERLYTVGFATIGNPFAELLIDEGIIHSLADEANSLITSGKKPSGRHLLWNATTIVLEVMKSATIFSEKVFHIEAHDEQPNKGSRSKLAFFIFTQLLAARTGVMGSDMKEWFANEADSTFKNCNNYVDIQSQIMHEYEIPIIGSSVEQPLLDHSKLDTVLPHNLLVRSYGEHFRLQAGKVFKAIPSPPFAGMVLGESKSSDDIIDNLLKLRDKHKSYRLTLGRLKAEMSEARRAATTRGWMAYRRLQEDVENVIKKSLENIEEGFKPKKKIIFRLWDLVKSGKPLQILTNILDQPVKRQEAKDQVLRVEGIFEVVSSFPDIPFLDISAERLFGKKFESGSIESIADGIELMDSIYGIKRHSTNQKS